MMKSCAEAGFQEFADVVCIAAPDQQAFRLQLNDEQLLLV